MSTEVTLPRLGQGMESGTIVRWLKSEGDTVAQDEPLYELDTEKVTQEVESPVAGVLLKILAGEGEEIEVGKPICVIGEAGEEVTVEAPPAATEEAEPAETDGARTGPNRPRRTPASSRAPRRLRRRPRTSRSGRRAARRLPRRPPSRRPLPRAGTTVGASRPRRSRARSRRSEGSTCAA